jgi:hypothetical protein
MVQKGGARRAGLGPPLARYSYECPDVVPGGGVAEAVESGLPLSVMVTDTGVPGSQAFRARAVAGQTDARHGYTMDTEKLRKEASYASILEISQGDPAAKWWFRLY